MRFGWPALLLLTAAVGAKEPDVRGDPELWPRLKIPKKGTWLDLYHEEGQTFAEYRAAGPFHAPTRERSHAYVLPLFTRPATDPQLPERIRGLLEAYFQRPARLMKPRPLPRHAYSPKRHQVSVTELARGLYPSLPKDAFLVVVVTDRDLYSRGLNHLFGWGSDRLRMAIVSTARVDVGPERRVRRRRILSLAVHEAVHTLSLPHCTFYPCLMNGAAHRAEADRRPFPLCPVCRAKLHWALPIDAARRDRALAAYPQEQELGADAARVRKAAAAGSGAVRVSGVAPLGKRGARDG